MNQMLQDAIYATRAGNHRQAQLLLAQNLKENPDDVHSWYLLSLLVESKEKQSIYLSKALTLDPEHEKANERMTILQYASEKEVGEQSPAEPTNITISEGSTDFLTQADGNTLPDWMAGDADSLQLEKVGMTITDEIEEETAEDSPSQKQVPQWLQENVSESWIVQEPPTQISTGRPADKPDVKSQPAKQEAQKATKPSRRKSRPKRPRTKQEEKTRLNWVLGGLIVTMILVLLILVVIAF